MELLVDLKWRVAQMRLFVIQIFCQSELSHCKVHVYEALYPVSNNSE